MTMNIALQSLTPLFGGGNGVVHIFGGRGTFRANNFLRSTQHLIS